MLEADGDKRFNTAVFLGSSGQRVGKYHKQHLGHETVRNTPGSRSLTHVTPFGRAGMMICAHRRFRKIVNAFVTNGANFLLGPSAGMFDPEHNNPILQARSRETGKYIVFVHPAEFLVTAPDGSIAYRIVLGDRLLIDPSDIGGTPDKNRIFYFQLLLGKEKFSRAK